MLKIYTVTNAFYENVSILFKDYGVTKILPTELKEIKELGEIDLIVFTGGSDINPRKYGYGETLSDELYNNKRDELELRIMKWILNGDINCKKVLGICRGLQLINVALGGTLILDIGTFYGKSHKMNHELKHPNKHPFDFLTRVNSLHHQCVTYCGEDLRFSVLSVCADDSSIEALQWDDRFFGVQFHPELFPESFEDKHKFSYIVNKWVNGEVSFLQQVNKSNKQVKKNEYVGLDWSIPITVSYTTINGTGETNG